MSRLRHRSLQFARRFLFADTPALSPGERWRSSLGAFAGIVLSGLVLHLLPHQSHWMLAPLGASMVILAVQPHSPVARPWSVAGSYLVATAVGLTVATLVPVPQLAAALAVAVCLWLMARLNCIHPAGGALALLLVLDGPYDLERIRLTAQTVALNVAVLLLVAALVNRWLLRRRMRYGAGSDGSDNPHQTGDATPLRRLDLSHEDLEWAVHEHDTFVDIQEAELLSLYQLSVRHAFERHVGLSCGDIMSRALVTVEFGTPLEEAWTLLRRHKIKALPVVDRFGHPQGILTVADFLRQMDDTTAAGLAVRLQGLLRRTPGPSSEKAEVVGQIMSPQVETARTDTPVSELVERLSERNRHHIPVLDDKRRVIGMVTQSDLIAALYKQVALAAA